MHGYFDYNATSLLRPEAAGEMRAWIEAGGGNPSSMHVRGRRARLAIENARRQVAALADGAAAHDVVFTSGATESNNTVLRSFAAAYPEAPIFVSEIDHHSVLATVDALERGGQKIVRLRVRPDSSVDLSPLAGLAANETCLVALGLANGETGAVLDVDALLDAVSASAFVHLDAAQAAGRLAIRFDSRVDALSMSGHKFGAPPGVGVLFASERLRRVLRPLLTGGPQEWSLRAGTPNVPGIVAMGAAAEAARATRDAEASRLRELRERLWNRLASSVSEIVRISPPDGLSNTLTVAVADLAADTLIAALDLAGFCVSAGSACAAGSPEPSHVMRALGLDRRWHGGVLRLSSGWATSERDVDALADAMIAVVARAREAA
jgi:cysteine desulfurase